MGLRKIFFPISPEIFPKNSKEYAQSADYKDQKVRR